MKVIIVGGVAGGASAAARLRRLDEHATITLYERSGYISYANCGLPYYVGDIITDKNALTLQSPESLFNRFQIVAKIKHEVIQINPSAKSVRVRNLVTGEEFDDFYDKLILSPGAKAIKPSISGIDANRIFTLRTVEDTLRIHDFIKKEQATSAIIVGGGFIGLEMAENLCHLGMEVTIVEASPQLFAPLDLDMIPQVHATFREHGVRLLLNIQATAFLDNTTSITCQLNNATTITADMVLLAIGVTPDTTIAQEAGIATGIKGGIVVNDKMETSIPDIYAVGDAVLVTHFITGTPSLISLAGPANRQGRIVANNLCGKESHYHGTQGSSIIKLFDLTVAVTGINEREAQKHNLSYEKVILFPASHASYYPGGTSMSMKVLFDKENDRILGAQIVGFDGVDKRIDVLATAIRSGMKASELTDLELAYAPPYSSAKDSVNMAGFIIENIIDGTVRQFYYEDIDDLQTNDNAFLLDARTPFEYGAGHANGFVNIPVDVIRKRLHEIPKDKTIYVMCQSGIRSYIACRILEGFGYHCYNFAGGYRFYSMVANECRLSAHTFPCGMDKNE